VFTGIIESLGIVTNIEKDQENLHLTVASPISSKLKVDQSISHNGVCLTVVELHEDLEGNAHTVTAIKETLLKSSIGDLAVGDKVNLERCMQVDARLDGHFVQGHVDQTGVCTSVKEADGSWYYTFKFEPNDHSVIVEKGSICVNGASLTLVDAKADSFSVAIIPYTWEHTNFHQIKAGTVVNLEFDVIGKYIVKLFAKYKNYLS